MYCSRCGTQNKDTAKFCDSCGLDLTATTPVGATTEPREITEIDMVRQELDEEYEILDELGRGGMAIVFKAKEKQLDREVAIKVLPFSLAFDKEFVERFQREARTSARLEHPNIIPIYRVGKKGRVIYFVMKFLRGKPLSSVLAARGGGGLPPLDIRRILAEVSRALAYAHKGGIVHRDIKPDNIMFDEHGHAVVTDFGIAKAASGGKLTGTGMSIGTPHYMSPEQAKAQQLDGRSDIYSLGVVAYQCLTGGVPFDGEDSFSIGYKHIMEEIPTPPIDSHDKRTLFEIIKKMMAKLPDQRFQSAEELVAVLEGGRSVSFTTDATMAIPSMSSVRLATAPTTPLPRATGGRPTAAEPARRSVAAGLALWLVIVGSVLGVGGFFAYREGLIFASSRNGAADSTALADSTRLADSTARVDSVRRADSLAQAALDSTRAAAPRRPPAPPGTPGRLALRNVPRGSRVSIDGQPVRGTELDLPPGLHRLVVRSAGYQRFDRQVPIIPGDTLTLAIELIPSRQADGPSVGPCEQFGPAYNQDNLCFDTRPVPLSPTLIPVPTDAPVFPRQAILLIKVSRNGTTLEARVYAPSNVDTFNNAALDMARSLRWNPAQKNGDPVEAWVQWPFQPVRQ
ncbi:MAG: protein kinase [Gemmatimonadales bacterium]|nr:protein kinase [Gemmatimonadales bacterium]